MKRLILFILVVIFGGLVLASHHPKPPVTQVIHTDKPAAPDGLTASQREEYYAR
jgi:hypothetical protein